MISGVYFEMLIFAKEICADIRLKLSSKMRRRGRHCGDQHPSRRTPRLTPIPNPRSPDKPLLRRLIGLKRNMRFVPPARFFPTQMSSTCQPCGTSWSLLVELRGHISTVLCTVSHSGLSFLKICSNLILL